MFVHRIIAAAIAVLFSVAPIAADPMPPVVKPLSSVVQIITSSGGSCTGFHIGGGRIVTAGHCIDGLSGYTVIFSDDTSAKGRLIMFSDARMADDMAVIKISAFENMETDALYCREAPAVGTAIRITGYPGGYGLSTVWGLVAGASRAYDGAWRDAIPVNVSVAPGFSGAPVYDHVTGKVIGILVGALGTNASLALMTPGYRLCEFIGADYL